MFTFSKVDGIFISRFVSSPALITIECTILQWHLCAAAYERWTLRTHIRIGICALDALLSRIDEIVRLYQVKTNASKNSIENRTLNVCRRSLYHCVNFSLSQPLRVDFGPNKSNKWITHTSRPAKTATDFFRICLSPFCFSNVSPLAAELLFWIEFPQHF